MNASMPCMATFPLHTNFFTYFTGLGTLVSETADPAVSEPPISMTELPSGCGDMSIV